MTSVSTEDIIWRNKVIMEELKDIKAVGKELNAHFYENDDEALQRLVEMEAREHDQM